MRKPALLAAGLVALGGCIPFAGLPRIDRTPPVKLGAPKDEVHAFRVDVSRSVQLQFSGESRREQYSSLPVSDAAEVSAQLKTTPFYGAVVIGVALNYVVYFSGSLELRVYRPGYELLKVPSGGSNGRVEWKPAVDLASREKALDELFPWLHIDYKSKSPEHLAALAFGAAEYHRLESMAATKEDRERLAKKANDLRERSEGPKE